MKNVFGGIIHLLILIGLVFSGSVYMGTEHELQQYNKTHTNPAQQADTKDYNIALYVILAISLIVIMGFVWQSRQKVRTLIYLAILLAQVVTIGVVLSYRSHVDRKNQGKFKAALGIMGVTVFVLVIVVANEYLSPTPSSITVWLAGLLMVTQSVVFGLLVEVEKHMDHSQVSTKKFKNVSWLILSMVLASFVLVVYRVVMSRRQDPVQNIQRSSGIEMVSMPNPGTRLTPSPRLQPQPSITPGKEAKIIK